MTEPVFVDTNVFVYARDAGERVKQAAAGPSGPEKGAGKRLTLATCGSPILREARVAAASPKALIGGISHRIGATTLPGKRFRRPPPVSLSSGSSNVIRTTPCERS